MKEYCTQNNGRCETCSLTNYGRDCMNVPIVMPDEEKREEVENGKE